MQLAKEQAEAIALREELANEPTEAITESERLSNIFN
jgi:hypothetical protein